MKFRTIAYLLLVVSTSGVAALRSLAGDLPATSDSVQMKIEANEVGPRELEDLTKNAIGRDYSAAWAALAQALEQNNSDLLNAHFTGFAKDNFAQRVADQRRAGVHTRYRDLGHHASILFYSPEGLGVQLLDEAQMEIQIFDGDSMVSSTKVTRHYIALLTPAEVSWKVRILQDVPNTV